MTIEVVLGGLIVMWAFIYCLVCPFGIFVRVYKGAVTGNFVWFFGCQIELTAPMKVAQAFVLSMYLFPDVICLVVFCCSQQIKKSNNLSMVFAAIFMFSVVLRPFSFVLFFEVVGNVIGTTWTNLTTEALLILLFDSTSALVFLGIIIFQTISWIQDKNRCCKPKMGTSVTTNRKGLTTLKYTKRFRPYNKTAEYNETNLMQAVGPAEKCDFGIRQLVADLWEPAKVGIGKDAKALRHSRITIDKIDYIGCAEPLNGYNERKRKMTTSVLKHSKNGQLYGLVDYNSFTRDISTRLKCAQLDASVDDRLNECYLFHGTLEQNVASIAAEGFRLPILARMLGNGIYFSDSPVKADQYAGKGNTGVIILSRVLLGNAAVTRTVRQYTTDDLNTGSVRNSVCCFTRAELPKHSLVYDGGLFREYVVYESCQAFPEFAIYYSREESGNVV